MSAKLKKLALMLTMAVIFLSLTLVNMKVVDASSTGGEIDLFTQKEPYSGKGLNISSDAFGLGEDVQIYALATYNGDPLENILVAFEISGPKNPVENITCHRAVSTNETGIATVSFRVPNLKETAFGEWTVVGNAKIANLTVKDSVKFKVGWIVEIISIKTINENHVPQEKFPRGRYVGIELVLRNIAMTPKVVYLTATVYDLLNKPVNSTELKNFVVPPNEILVNAYLFLYLPRTTQVGNATVYACAYTSSVALNELAYCPEVSKSFVIFAQKYFLKVGTEPSGIITIPGEDWYEEDAIVNLMAPALVTVSRGIRYRFSYWSSEEIFHDRGNGSIVVLMYTDHTVTAHYILQYYLTVNSQYGISGGEGWYDAGSAAYATLNINVLDHGNGTRRVFTSWSGDSSGINYTRSNPMIMDNPKTAIADWKTQYYLTVRINPVGIATIPGEGWYDESVNVTVNAPTVSDYNFEYWDVNGVSQSSRVASIRVHMNVPHIITAYYTRIITYTLTITTTKGGTTNPAPGTYNYTAGSIVQITALPDADYIFNHWELNNTAVASANPYTVTMNKNQTLRAVFSPAPTGWFVPDWFYWFLLPLFFLMIILLIIGFYYRKKRKESEEAFHTGWTAWYYCYDLRSENP